MSMGSLLVIVVIITRSHQHASAPAILTRRSSRRGFHNKK